MRLLPITERWLQAISAVITIATAIGIANALRMFSHDFDVGVAPRLWPLYLVIAGVALSAVGWSAALFLRKRTSYFFPTALAPVLAGVTDRRGRGRIAVIRYSGTCPIDGDKLRFYRRPLAWTDHRDPVTGRVQREITDSEPAAECTKYPRRHCWPIDPTDIRYLDGL